MRVANMECINSVSSCALASCLFRPDRCIHINTQCVETKEILPPWQRTDRAEREIGRRHQCASVPMDMQKRVNAFKLLLPALRKQ